MRVWAECVCVFCKLGEGSLGWGGLKGGIVLMGFTMNKIILSLICLI